MSKARPLPMPRKAATRAPKINRNVNAVMLGVPSQQPSGNKPLPSLDTSGRPSPSHEKVRNGAPKVLPAIKTFVEKFDCMIAGDIDDMPPKPQTEVRIFLSSTFSDMRHERNSLMTQSYPRLRAFCYSELDVDLHVVDMRWGITDDATNEHVTEQLCLDEIANCQRLSLGTCFVCILGDRYGYRPLPSFIPAAEYDLIYEEAKKQDHPKFFLLEQWYKKDENAVPAQYVLQTIRSQLSNFGVHDNSGLETLQSKAARQAWWDMSDNLLTVIRGALDKLAERGLISEERCHDYNKSVTEFEISEGLKDNPNSRCLCFLRRFKGLSNDTVGQNKLAARFIEVANKHGHKVIDDKVAALRKSLQETKIPGVLQASQLGFTEVAWHQEGLDPDLYPDHKDYIESFTRNFTMAVMNQINEAKSQQKNYPQKNYYSYFPEIYHHLDFAKKKVSGFKGQADVVEKVKEQLLDRNMRCPIIIHADSGAGKTSVIAKLFLHVREWLGKNCVRVIRFLGTSPDSTEIYTVLKSVMGQLADNYDMILEPDGRKTFKGVIKYLPRVLRNMGRTAAAAKEHIVIFLDSVDQLVSKDGAYFLRWLPTELPANVHFIISTLPEHGDILKNATKQIHLKSAFIQVKPLPEETGKEILDGYLNLGRRTLNAEQKELLLRCIGKVASPLYVKLLADRALTWKSYTNVDQIKLGSTVRLAISQLFGELETRFGSVLIRHALGYLTIGMNGLTEVELEDSLSCDDEILNEVYQYHNPPVPGVVTIPPMLWARIRNDISEYITERQTEGKTTLYWYHRQFIEVATERYVQGNEEKLHGHLADYFTTENGIKRDITLLKRNLIIHSADRQISAQPLVPKNKRKLQALPYHLKRCKDTNRLKAVALMSLNFMTTKIEGLGLSALIADYDDVDDYDLQKIQQCLMELRPVWRSMSLFPSELLARLQDENHLFLTNLLGDCRDYVQQGSMTLMPLFPCLSKTTLLQSVHPDSYLVHSQSSSGKQLVVGTSPEAYKLIDIETNQEAHLGYMEVLLPPVLSKDGKFVYFTQKVLKKSSANKKNKVKKGVNLVVHKASVESLVKADSVDMEECLTVQIDPEDMPSDLDGIRVNDIDVSVNGRYIAMCFNDKYLIVKDVKQSSTPGLISELKIKGQQGLVSTGKTSRVMFTQNGNKVIAMVGCADEGTLWTSVNVQDMDDMKDRAFHIPGLAWFNQVALLHSDSTLFIAVKDAQTTRIGLVDITSGTGLSVDYLKLDMHIAGITTAGLDKPKVYICSHQYVYVHDLITRQLIHQLSTEPFSNSLVCVAVEEDEEHVYVGDSDGNVHIWKNAKYAGGMKVDQNVRSVILSKDDENVITLASDGTLKVWRQDSLFESAAMKSIASEASSEKLSDCLSASGMIFHPDGQHIITDHVDCYKIWNIENNVCQRTILKPEDFLFCGDVLMWDKTGKLLYSVNRSVYFKISMCFIESGEFPSVDALKEEEILSATLSKDNKLYVMIKKDVQMNVIVFDPAKQCVEKTIIVTSRNTFLTDDIEIAITSSGGYLVFKILTNEKENQIIRDAERKGNLPQSLGKFKFAALDLENPTKELLLCYRRLTKVQTLGSTFEMLDDNTVLIARERVTVQWDISKGSCDSMIVKGTKTPQYFRPIWIEDDHDWHNICYGLIHSLHRVVPPGGSGVVAQGSEDGWCMIYDETGQSVNINMGKHSNHNGSPVKHVRVSPDGEWVVSASANTVLKCWSVLAVGKEIFSIKLNMKVTDIQFDRTSLYVAVLGQCTNGSSMVALFMLVGH